MEERKIYETPAAEVTCFEMENIMTDSVINLPEVGWGESGSGK